MEKEGQNAPQYPEVFGELAEKALEARARSYAPYSGFTVGAAVLAGDGRIYTGCNIENASYPAGICAERTAVFKAVSEGARSVAAIAIAGGPAWKKAVSPCPPCGICRQVLREFCASPEKLAVILPESDDEGRVTSLRLFTLEDLLPESFGPGSL